MGKAKIALGHGDSKDSQAQFPNAHSCNLGNIKLWDMDCGQNKLLKKIEIVKMWIRATVKSN